MVAKMITYHLVIKDDIENLEVQNEIDDLIESIGHKLLENNTENVSIQFVVLSRNNNYGKCSCCAVTVYYRNYNGQYVATYL